MNFKNDNKKVNKVKTNKKKNICFIIFKDNPIKIEIVKKENKISFTLNFKSFCIS